MRQKEIRRGWQERIGREDGSEEMKWDKRTAGGKEVTDFYKLLARGNTHFNTPVCLSSNSYFFLFPPLPSCFESLFDLLCPSQISLSSPLLKQAALLQAALSHCYPYKSWIFFLCSFSSSMFFFLLSLPLLIHFHSIISVLWYSVEADVDCIKVIAGWAASGF